MTFKKTLMDSTAVLTIAIGMILGTPAISEGKIATPIQHESQSKRILYGSPSSPFVFKVLVAMDEKRLPFSLIDTLPVKTLGALGQKASPEFIHASPLGKIPAYKEGNWTIADSSVIIAYLDRKNPGKPLYPSEPQEFAETLWFENYGDEVMAGTIHKKILFEMIVKPNLLKIPTDKAIVAKAVNEELPEIFSYLERALEGHLWIVGNQFTAADIAIGTHLATLKRCKIDINPAKWPNVAAYAQRLFDRPSFKNNML